MYELFESFDLLLFIFPVFQYFKIYFIGLESIVEKQPSICQPSDQVCIQDFLCLDIFKGMNDINCLFKSFIVNFFSLFFYLLLFNRFHWRLVVCVSRPGTHYAFEYHKYDNNNDNGQRQQQRKIQQNKSIFAKISISNQIKCYFFRVSLKLSMSWTIKFIMDGDKSGGFRFKYVVIDL